MKSRFLNARNVWCGTIHKIASRVLTAGDEQFTKFGTLKEVFSAFTAACKKLKLQLGDCDDLIDDCITPEELAGSKRRLF